MKRMSKSIPRAISVCALSLTIAGMVYLASRFNVQADNRAEQGPSESQAPKLVGTWRADVTLRVCQTGAVIRTFPALSTYAKGGTMNSIAAGSNPARNSADYGIWRHEGGQTYTGQTDALLFNAGGEFSGIQRVSRYIQIGDDGDHSTANVSIEIFDASGNLVLNGCATAVATRME